MDEMLINTLRKQIDNLIHQVSSLENKVANLATKFERDQKDTWTYISTLERKFGKT